MKIFLWDLASGEKEMDFLIFDFASNRGVFNHLLYRSIILAKIILLLNQMRC